MKFFDRDTVDVLDYCWDWEDWLDGDTIQSIDFTFPDDLVKEYESFTDTTATIWLSGGELNENYQISCTITTVGGRTKKKSAMIVMVNE